MLFGHAAASGCSSVLPRAAVIRPLGPAVAVAVTAAAIVISGCGSTSSTTLGPTPVKCDVAIAPPGQIGPGGGTGTIGVSTQPECSWNVSTQANWITRLSPRSGQGSGQIEFDAAPNPVQTVRQAEIVVNDASQVRQAATVIQSAACIFSIQPSQLSIGVSGGPGTTAVTGTPGCGWTASSQVSWIAVSSGATGSGDGTVAFTVAANGGPLRAGTLAVAGQTMTVTQASGCSYAIQPGAQSVGASPASGSTAVTAAEGCTWTATSQVPWITVTSGASGSGGGTVGFTIAANTSPARAGSITIATQTFTVNQASGCTYSVQPTSVPATAAGGASSVSITSGTGCPWTSESHAPWISINGSGSGNGDGSVTFTVASNQGPERPGTLTIAGRTVTVTQATGCTFSLSTGSQTFGNAGGQGTVTVTTAPGCAWTAVSNVSNPAWITVMPPGGGTGSGTVVYIVSPNFIGNRSGSMTIAGQTFMVSQVN